MTRRELLNMVVSLPFVGRFLRSPGAAVFPLPRRRQKVSAVCGMDTSLRPVIWSDRVSNEVVCMDCGSVFDRDQVHAMMAVTPVDSNHAIQCPVCSLLDVVLGEIRKTQKT